ncbi:unnamed protein product [Phaeothamnion confervicola]
MIDLVDNVDQAYFPVFDLMSAVREGDVKAAKLFLDAGSDIHEFDRSGQKPLHAAAYWGRADVVAILLERGADVNARSRSGATALHFGARCGSVETVEVLMRHGADPKLENNEGSRSGDAFLSQVDFRTRRKIYAFLHWEPNERTAWTPPPACKDCDSCEPFSCKLHRQYELDLGLVGDLPGAAAAGDDDDDDDADNGDSDEEADSDGAEGADDGGGGSQGGGGVGTGGGGGSSGVKGDTVIFAGGAAFELGGGCNDEGWGGAIPYSSDASEKKEVPLCAQS